MSTKDEREQNRLRKSTCEELYTVMGKTVEDIVAATGARPQTLYRWIKEGGWNEKKNEVRVIEKQIEMSLKEALVKGLKAFAENPHDKDLQSLVGLLKQVRDKHKPTQTYKENILKFLDMTTDYFLENELVETAGIFKSKVRELAEYLLRN
jgi:transposase-like protein